MKSDNHLVANSERSTFYRIDSLLNKMEQLATYFAFIQRKPRYTEML